MSGFLGFFRKEKVEYVVKSGNSIWGSHDDEEDAKKEVALLKEQGFLYATYEKRVVGEPVKQIDEAD
jgi:hypothetical protein